MNKNEKQNKDNTKHTAIRLPIEIYEEILKLAEKQERTVSEQIRYIIKEYLKLKNS